MLFAVVEDDEAFYLGGGDLGLLASEPVLGLGDLHAFTGASADEVGGVVVGSAKAELDIEFGEVLDDVPRVRQGAREAVELGDGKGVAGAAGCEGLLESGAFAVHPREDVVDVDQLVRNSECLETGLLGAEVLLVGGDAGVPDQVR